MEITAAHRKAHHTLFLAVQDLLELLEIVRGEPDFALSSPVRIQRALKRLRNAKGRVHAFEVSA